MPCFMISFLFCRQTLHDYTLRLKPIIEVIFKGMSRSLNLESNPFWEQYGESGTMFARFNFYPPCPRPELVYGLKPHADGSAITVVLPDKEVAGLQFLRDGKWVMVPINPHALLINIGDQVEVLNPSLINIFSKILIQIMSEAL